MITMDFKEVDNVVLVIGKTEGHIDQSLFARVILDEKNGPPPEINLFNEKNNGETLLKLIDNNLIKSAHDISLGGIITAVSKMCIKGNKGINLKKPKYLISEIEYFFGEDQGRYIVEISKKDQKSLIKEAMPDAIVEIQDLAGDGNHYSATITSSQFSGKSKIEQHKMVYNSLKGRMGNELHALAIKTKEN